MRNPQSILVIQTAFPGDVILTTPLFDSVKRCFPSSVLDVVAIPRGAELLKHHPSVRDVIIYDKRRHDRGLGALVRTVRLIRKHKYDMALIPHRSLRSAALAMLAGIPVRVGFNRSAGRMLLTDIVTYQDSIHEIDRNLSLLKPLGFQEMSGFAPSLHPGRAEIYEVDDFFTRHSIDRTRAIIAIGPGTVWNTKRWLPSGFAAVARELAQPGNQVILIGGEEDRLVCEDIRTSAGSTGISNAAGSLSILASAELIRRSTLLLTNDSAPLHMAGAMGTPVVALFGATVPEFGFGPSGKGGIVVQTSGLTCRPCSIHGGDRCPIGTFDCMERILPVHVLEKIYSLMAKHQRA